MYKITGLAMAFITIHCSYDDNTMLAVLTKFTLLMPQFFTLTSFYTLSSLKLNKK